MSVKTKNSSLISNVYPFFLNNTDLKSYYLYKVVSPEYLSDLTPLLSLHKISERTRKGDFAATKTDMRHGDLLATIMKSRRVQNKNMAEFLEKEIANSSKGKEDKVGQSTVYPNGDSFPLFDMDSTGLLTKLILINLRDSIRWTQYKFSAGNYIDIMLTEDTYGVFKIEEENKALYLVPEGVYNNYDTERLNPLEVDLGTLDYPKDKFTGEKRASDMNRAIRQAEWKSFDRE